MKTQASSKTFHFLFRAVKHHFQTRAKKGELKLDLGLQKLLPEWQSLFTVQGLRQDLWAGLMVSGAAVPLSLAIALGSEVEPSQGLISAILAGVICALFGGTRLSVSGPANSMLVLIALIVERAGVAGLFFVGLVCGLIQILTGVLGFGKLVRYVPLPLVAGFTAGIGIIMFAGQIPRALGLPVPPSGDIGSVITHLGSLLHESQPRVFLLSLLAVAATQLVPRLNPRIPGSFFGVLLPTLLVAFAEWDVPRLGDLGHHVLSLHWPGLPSSGFLETLEMGFLLFALASLDSRFSSLAVDKLIPGERHDADQELIGQGLSNTLIACLGGIPVTGVVARSVLNIRAGAQTRRAALFHALFVLFGFLFLKSGLSQIPVAALSGVLLSIAWNMINPKEVFKIWRSSPVETIVFWVTLATVVMVDLMAGVQMGIFAALLIALWNLGQAKLFFHSPDTDENIRVSLSGNITFMASRNFEVLNRKIERSKKVNALIVDMSEVKVIDSSGASMLLELMKDWAGRGVKVLLKGLNRTSRGVIESVDFEKIAQGAFITSESEIAEVLRKDKSYDPRSRILFGVERYRGERKKVFEELFDQLGKQQKPHTLFITCSDSRINPALITSSEPGELFLVRNVGNIVPPVGVDDMPAEGAAVEFSLGALGVEEIIICGHTRCGALKGAFDGIDANQFPSVAKWVEPIAKERAKHPEITDPEEFGKIHVVEQARNILTYPIVRKKVGLGQVRIHCWIYDVTKGEFLEWTGKGTEFVPVGPQSLHGNIQELLGPSQSDY